MKIRAKQTACEKNAKTRKKTKIFCMFKHLYSLPFNNSVEKNTISGQGKILRNTLCLSQVVHCKNVVIPAQAGIYCNLNNATKRHRNKYTKNNCEDYIPPGKSGPKSTDDTSTQALLTDKPFLVTLPILTQT